MKKLSIIPAVVGASVLAVISMTVSLQADGRVPAILQVPEGNVLLLHAHGRGTQKYACPISASSKAVPHAILLHGDDGNLVAIYFGGPTWEALDGSAVVGDTSNAKHFTAPDPDAIDWLLIPAQSTTGNGQFSRVAYIQRLFTKGGTPPAAGCGQADQTEVLVEYSAEYLFYGPAAVGR